MLKKILSFKVALMISLGLFLFCPGVFAQGHQDGHNGRNAGMINRGNESHSGGNGPHSRGNGSGYRHYYHNGNWNRNGWFGWWAPAPVFTSGVLVASLPPGSTTVVVQGNTYYYGENTYFRQVASGGYAVVTIN